MRAAPPDRTSPAWIVTLAKVGGNGAPRPHAALMRPCYSLRRESMKIVDAFTPRPCTPNDQSRPCLPPQTRCTQTDP